MTYNDPNYRNPINPNPDRPSYPMTRQTNYTAWIIGGIAAVVLALGILFMVNRNDTTSTAANTNPPAPTTTGSGGTVPLPGSGQGTAGNAKQTVPSPR
jgi:hypothetical protein